MVLQTRRRRETGSPFVLLVIEPYGRFVASQLVRFCVAVEVFASRRNPSKFTLVLQVIQRVRYTRKHHFFSANARRHKQPCLSASAACLDQIEKCRKIAVDHSYGCRIRSGIVGRSRFRLKPRKQRETHLSVIVHSLSGMRFGITNGFNHLAVDRPVHQCAPDHGACLKQSRIPTNLERRPVASPAQIIRRAPRHRDLLARQIDAASFGQRFQKRALVGWGPVIIGHFILHWNIQRNNITDMVICRKAESEKDFHAEAQRTRRS